MNIIICNQIQVPENDFNEGTKKWHDANVWIDSLYVKYDVPHGIKDLFFSLIRLGIAKSVDKSRIVCVEKILELEGLKIERCYN